jgi:UDP-3-O-[3-hydroxymyristoyl] glucosamine N-acyltransferase
MQGTNQGAKQDNQQVTLHELADSVGGQVEGDDCLITGVATLEQAQPGTISFFSNRAYKKYLQVTNASAVILLAEDIELCPVSALVTENPYLTYAHVAAFFNPEPPFQSGVHPSAVIDHTSKIDSSAWVGPNCTIGPGVIIEEGVFIGPGCVIEKGASIGKFSKLVANVTICHQSLIGQHVLIHPGVVIGSDGFGIANNKGVWVKVPQLGKVQIGDHVEIGANTTIDRGALDDTVVEEGVKLDNQIQVAHNVHIGAHTAIAGCVGIAGSTTIGKHCAIGGAVSIIGHLEIADGVTITATSFVSKSIKKPGLYSSGVPIQENSEWSRNTVRYRQLDDMARRLSKLEKKLDSK